MHMRIRIILFGLVSIFIVGCKSPEFLPGTDEIHMNQYGSYITFKLRSYANIKGELIAVDSNALIVLSEKKMECVVVPKSDIFSFKIKYADQRNYGWMIPILSLSTISHGLFLIFSLPANLIVTSIVASSGEKAVSYTNEDISYEALKMFARFPQGIPPGITLEEIH